MFLKDACSAVAVCLHYFFLSAFMWMSVEGYHLYSLVVRVFDTHKDKMVTYYVIGYGIPFLIVLLVYSVSVSVGDKAYGRDEL